MDFLNNLPLVTEFPSRKHWEAGVWEIIIIRLAEIKSVPELKKALELLLGQKERERLLYRGLTISRLNKKLAYREIGRELWVSPQTISAVKKSLLENSYQSSYKRGHIKKQYSPLGRKSVKKVYTRNIKGGTVRDWRISG
jgi:Trp operon repressor